MDLICFFRPSVFKISGLDNLNDLSFLSALDPPSIVNGTFNLAEIEAIDLNPNPVGPFNLDYPLDQKVENRIQKGFIAPGCKYWKEQKGWIAFLFLNFTVFFLVPLFVSFLFCFFHLQNSRSTLLF